MKNVTISIGEDLFDAVRIIAAERGKSLSALIAELLRDMVQAEESCQSSAADYFSRDVLFNSGGRKFSREEIYDRKVLR